MNYIKKLHLDALDENTIHHQEVPNDIDTIKSAQKSAEITEQIAVEFAEFYENFWKNLSLADFIHDDNGFTTKQLFQEFLKTKL